MCACAEASRTARPPVRPSAPAEFPRGFNLCSNAVVDMVKSGRRVFEGAEGCSKDWREGIRLGGWRVFGVNCACVRECACVRRACVVRACGGRLD